MKATGIVRRIDELGRVVIPKEIRRTQRIRQGDALEIFTDTNGEVVFKKYSRCWAWASSPPSMPRFWPKTSACRSWFATGTSLWPSPARAAPS